MRVRVGVGLMLGVGLTGDVEVMLVEAAALDGGHRDEGREARHLVRVGLGHRAKD